MPPSRLVAHRTRQREQDSKCSDPKQVGVLGGLPILGLLKESTTLPGFQCFAMPARSKYSSDPFSRAKEGNRTARWTLYRFQWYRSSELLKQKTQSATTSERGAGGSHQANPVVSRFTPQQQNSYVFCWDAFCTQLYVCCLWLIGASREDIYDLRFRLRSKNGNTTRVPRRSMAMLVTGGTATVNGTEQDLWGSNGHLVSLRVMVRHHPTGFRQNQGAE